MNYTNVQVLANLHFLMFHLAFLWGRLPYGFPFLLKFLKTRDCPWLLRFLCSTDSTESLGKWFCIAILLSISLSIKLLIKCGLCSPNQKSPSHPNVHFLNFSRILHFNNDTQITPKFLPHKSYLELIFSHIGFPGGSEVKASACNVGDLGSIPGLGRSPGEGNGNPLQYSCLENPMDRGAWWATRVAKSQTWLSDFTFTFPHIMTFSRQ